MGGREVSGSVQQYWVPFWDIMRTREIEILGRRRLHHLTRGAYEVSEILPCRLNQVVTTTVCWCGTRPILILSTADVLIDYRIFVRWFGYEVRPATSTEVSALTSAHLQGVPPGGLPYMMPVFLDDVLLESDSLWIPAGDPSVWVRVLPPEVVKVSGAFPVSIRLAPPARDERYSYYAVSRLNADGVLEPAEPVALSGTD